MTLMFLFFLLLLVMRRTGTQFSSQNVHGRAEEDNKEGKSFLGDDGSHDMPITTHV